MEVNKMFHLMSLSWKQNVNFIERYYKKKFNSDLFEGY